MASRRMGAMGDGRKTLESSLIFQAGREEENGDVEKMRVYITSMCVDMEGGTHQEKKSFIAKMGAR